MNWHPVIMAILRQRIIANDTLPWPYWERVALMERLDRCCPGEF